MGTKSALGSAHDEHGVPVGLRFVPSNNIPCYGSVGGSPSLLFVRLEETGYRPSHRYERGRGITPQGCIMYRQYHVLVSWVPRTLEIEFIANRG